MFLDNFLFSDVGIEVTHHLQILITISRGAKAWEIEQKLYPNSLEAQVATFPSYITQKIKMIHIKVTNKVGHGVFIKKNLQIYMIYIHRSRL